MTTKNNSEDQAPAVDAPVQPQIDITPSDLMIIRQVFDAATQAGIFKASDLTAVGGVFDKVNAIVEGMIAASKATEETRKT